MKTSDGAAKDDRAKAVPLGLEQKLVAGGKLVGELREHRLDRRRDRGSLPYAPDWFYHGRDRGVADILDSPDLKVGLRLLDLRAGRFTPDLKVGPTFGPAFGSPRWTFTSSTAPTSYSATTTRFRRRGRPTAGKWRPSAASSPRSSA